VPSVSGHAADSEPDLAGVLDKLRQVREIDPSAEQKLVEQLRRTPSNSWPLVAEQFRASLAYREQLSQKNPETAKVSETAGRFDATAVAESAAMQTGYDSADAGTSSQPAMRLAKRDTSNQESRPSAPIGTLVDPRDADADGVSSEAMAKSTPYSTPGAIPQLSREALSTPGNFVAHESVYPISTNTRVSTNLASAATGGSSDPDVVPTRLDAVSGGSEADKAAEPHTVQADWRQLVQRAADDLNGRVAATPTTTAEVHQHVSLRMLRLLTGDTEKALEPIPHVSPAEQDYWSRQLFALATYLDHHTQPDDKRRAAASVTHLDEATASLRELGSLALRNLTFCKNVHGYGSIESFTEEQFSAGQQIALYVEIENYHSKTTEKGFITSLGSTYEILDEKGERITGAEFPDVDDLCRNRRRDFHIQYGLALPEKIEPGRYQLQLVVKDRQSDKIGHATIAFEIRGNRRLTTTPSPSTK
jgi:hypothetical protein